MKIEEKINLLKDKIARNNAKKETIEIITGLPITFLLIIFDGKLIGEFIKESTIFTKVVLALPALVMLPALAAIGLASTAIVSPAWLEYLAREGKNKRLNKKLKELEKSLVKDKVEEFTFDKTEEKSAVNSFDIINKATKKEQYKSNDREQE